MHEGGELVREFSGFLSYKPPPEPGLGVRASEQKGDAEAPTATRDSGSHRPRTQVPASQTPMCPPEDRCAPRRRDGDPGHL